MPLKQIRINEYTVEDLRRRGEQFGNPADDVIIRLILAENDKLYSENEKLYVKIEKLECEKSMLIKEISEFRKTLENYIGIKRD